MSRPAPARSHALNGVLVKIFAMPTCSRVSVSRMLSHAAETPAPRTGPLYLCAPPGPRQPGTHAALAAVGASSRARVQSGERARCTHTLNTQFKPYLSHSELLYMDPAKSSAILSTCGMADACTGKAGEIGGFGGG